MYTHMDNGNMILISQNLIVESMENDLGKKAQFANQNTDKWLATTQNVSPDESNFAVDIRKKRQRIPNSIRGKINSALHDLGDYHESIPLTEIFDILKQNGVIVLQEDGTKWSGFVTSQGDCGSEKANSQGPMQFMLAINTANGYVEADNSLVMTVCTMPSEKLEIVCYVS